jgi:hypothetical protein
MTGVSNPVHETKPCAGKKALAEMILDQDHFTHAIRFSEQEEGIRSVVEDVHEHHGVEARIRIRNVSAIERLNGYLRVWPDKHVNADDGDVRPVAGDEEIERSVSATNVQNARGGGNESGQLLRQNSDSTAEDQ